MTSPDLDAAVRTSLTRPMTEAQQRSLDTRLKAWLEPAPRRPLRFQSRWAALTLAALLVAAPAVFAVSSAIRSTESPNGLVSAEVFQAEIDAAKREVPLPAGATWPAGLAATDAEGSYSAGGGRSTVEFAAFCAWANAWLAATSSGSAGDATTARDVITTADTWEFYSGVFADQSLRDTVDTVIVAVQSGDAAPVDAFAAANCRN